MALAAEPADRNNQSALPPPWTLIRLNQHSVANEDAVFSESSLSQNTTHSARSTTATSFNIQGSCSNAEAQASGSQSGGDIELSSISGHGYPSDNPPQPILEDSTQSHDLSIIATEEQNESRNTFEPSNQQRSYATFFQDSLRSAYRYIPKYEITSNTIALMALTLTAFFGYETYKLAQESNWLAKIATGAQLRQTCNDEKEKGAFSEVCNQVLSSSIESPYVPETSNFVRRVLGVLQHHQNSSVVIYPRHFNISTLRWSFVFYGLLINLVLLISACTISGLNCGGFQSIRRLRRTLGSQPSAIDPVDFRLAHSQPDENALCFASGLQVNHPRARRRIVHYTYKQNHEEYSSSRSLESQSTASDPFYGRFIHSQPPRDSMSLDNGSQTTHIKSQRGVIHDVCGALSINHSGSPSLGSQTTAFSPIKSLKDSIDFRTSSQASQVARQRGALERTFREPSEKIRGSEKRSWQPNCEVTINVSIGRDRLRGVKTWL